MSRRGWSVTFRRLLKLSLWVWARRSISALWGSLREPRWPNGSDGILPLLGLLVPHLGLSEGKTCLLGAAVSSMSQLSPRSVRGADCDVFGVVWMFFLHCFLSPEAAQSGSPCSKAQIALVTAVNFPGFSPELENSNENNNAGFFFCFMC